MKVNLGKVFKKAVPVIRTGMSLVKAGKQVSSGNIDGAVKSLRKIDKRGDLKKVLQTVHDVKKKKGKKSTSTPIQSSPSTNKQEIVTEPHDLLSSLTPAIDFSSPRYNYEDVFYDPINDGLDDKDSDDIFHDIPQTKRRRTNVTQGEEFDGDIFY